MKRLNGMDAMLLYSETPNLHNPRYDFNDEVLAIGASYWVRLAEQELPART